jgi:glyoxylase I family protein
MCDTAVPKSTSAPPSVQFGCVQHVGMLVENTELAKRFYVNVLGMADDHAQRNPNLPFGGTFLRAGSSQIHLMELPSVDPKIGRPEHGGRFVCLHCIALLV